MASNQTEHYGLNQWSGDDNFVRTDFNEDNAKIDAALAGKADQVKMEQLAAAVDLKCRVKINFYTGDGAETRHIDLSLPIKALLLEDQYGERGSSSVVHCGLMLGEGSLGDPNYPLAKLSGGVLTVHHWGGNSASLNRNGNEYRYIAFV